MDKPISNTEQKKNSNRRKVKGLLILFVMVLGLLGFRQMVKPKIDASDIRIATLEIGRVQEAFSASGKVLAAQEIEINAPLNSEVTQVYLRAGQSVEKGMPILELEREYIALEVEQLKDALAVKRNNLELLSLRFDKTLSDIQHQLQIAELRIQEQESQLRKSEALQKVGGITPDEVMAQELQLKVSKLQRDQLIADVKHTKLSNKGEKENLRLELSIQEKALQERQSKLDKTQVRAPQSGVITFLNEDLGRKIQEGQLLTRIANLNAFKVEARCSDRFNERLELGQLVNVKVNNNQLQGIISNILPALENNTIQFEVSLAEADADFLRPNLYAEVEVVLREKKQVLRLARGSAINSSPTQYLYQIKGEYAYRVPIQKGIQAKGYIEIANDNFKAGDQFIISSMEDFDHLEQIYIRP